MAVSAIEKHTANFSAFASVTPLQSAPDMILDESHGSSLLDWPSTRFITAPKVIVLVPAPVLSQQNKLYFSYAMSALILRLGTFP
jgi:hypothetical protein